MGRFLRNFQLDRISFWLGFLTATLFWWLIGKLRPALSGFLEGTRARYKTTRRGLTASSEIRHRNDTLRYAQNLHLAAQLFSLDEILISPNLLAPPLQVLPGELSPPEEITNLTLPYMPDWPEMATTYGAPTLTLAEALKGDANLVIIGHTGSGKTVAFAHLTSQIIRKETQDNDLNSLVPILIHAANLQSPPSTPDLLLDTLTGAVAISGSTLTLKRLSAYLQSTFETGNVLLLIDGLDELPSESFEVVVDYLRQLMQLYPKIRSVVATSPYFFDGLTSLGFVPLAIATWDNHQRTTFFKQWGESWVRFVENQSPEPRLINPVLINTWLSNETLLSTPFELTLRAWSAYAGDLLGPNDSDAIEAYLRRMVVEIPEARPALEKLALKITLSMTPVISIKGIDREMAEFDLEISSSQDQVFPEIIAVTKALPALIESSLLCGRPDAIRFNHPIISGYLAGTAISSYEQVNGLIDNSAWNNQQYWVGQTTALQYFGSQSETKDLVSQYLDRSDDPLQKELFFTAYWLHDAPNDAPWRVGVMRKLANMLQNDAYPMGLRARALAALAASGTSGVDALFRKLLSSGQPEQRQLAALGCGQLRDDNAIEDLMALLTDPIPNVRRAACLALVAIGKRNALDAIADALLQGDEDLRRAAAEALANHPEVGHPTLEEGSTIDDLMVRRAIVFGLLRVRAPWSIKILETMQIEDSQWVVKDAASHALEYIAQSNPHIPQPLPALSETPWLIAFAGEQGIGLSPGTSALDLLLLALEEGTEEQRLAALDFLRLKGDKSAVLALYTILYSSKGELQAAAFNTLWHLGAAGIPLPPPVQFGIEPNN